MTIVPDAEGVLEIIAMSKPGQYFPDFTEGISRVGDLPKPKIIKRSRNYRRRPCPLCEHSAYRLRTGKRTLHVVAMAVRLVVEDGLHYRAASWHLWRDHRIFVPFATIENWVEAGGKKS